jgi:hypothetical protein
MIIRFYVSEEHRRNVSLDRPGRWEAALRHWGIIRVSCAGAGGFAQLETTFDTLRKMTLSEKGFCRQRGDMWCFDSANPWTCLISALQSGHSVLRLLPRKMMIGPHSAGRNPCCNCPDRRCEIFAEEPGVMTDFFYDARRRVAAAESICCGALLLTQSGHRPASRINNSH